MHLLPDLSSLGGDRSWEVGLRGGGVYFIPVGTGGIYMPIQVILISRPLPTLPTHACPSPLY